MDEPNFDIDDFKKWMNQQNNKIEFNRTKNSLIGLEVESKVSSQKLAEVLIPEEGETPELAFDFKKNGGIISEIDDKYFLIQVSEGSFHISRRYVRKK